MQITNSPAYKSRFLSIYNRSYTYYNAVTPLKFNNQQTCDSGWTVGTGLYWLYESLHSQFISSFHGQIIFNLLCILVWPHPRSLFPCRIILYLFVSVSPEFLSWSLHMALSNPFACIMATNRVQQHSCYKQVILFVEYWFDFLLPQLLISVMIQLFTDATCDVAASSRLSV